MINKAINALKNGNTLIIESTAIDCAGNARNYVDEITNKTNDIEMLSYFNNEDEIYQIQSKTIFSNDLVFSLEDVKKKLEVMQDNSLSFNIKIN